MAGNNITSQSRVSGDLVAAGGNVNIQGTIDQSVLAAGGNIDMNATVSQNARLAGGNISVKGIVGQDLSIAGGTVNINPDTTIQSDLQAAGGTINMNGTTRGSAKIAGQTVFINGEIQGDADVYADRLRVGDNAVIRGKLHYRSDTEAEISEQAQIGSVEFTRTEERARERTAGATALGTLINLLSVLLLLLVLRYVFPLFTRRVNSQVYDNPSSGLLRYLGIGLLALIAIPIITIFLFATLIGWRIALALLLAYFLLILLASAYSPLLIGYGVMRLIRRDDRYGLDFVTILVGVIIAALLSLVPVLGWLVLAIFFLIAFGSVMLAMYSFLAARRYREVGPDAASEDRDRPYRQ